MRDWLSWNSELVIVTLVIIIFVVGIVFGGMKLSEVGCTAKTENMGFAHRWSWLGGCQIEVTEGQWIPLESYYFKQE